LTVTDAKRPIPLPEKEIDLPGALAVSDAASLSVELSSRRTGMSFQRTRLSADRTLMSVIRTSLSLIGFGFTVFQFFRYLQEGAFITADSQAARNFGLALVFLGVGMVTVGILYHGQFMWALRRQRRAMKAEGLIHGESGFPVSFTFIIAILLLLLGVTAFASMVFNVGPFG
jgi:putative membrane protein